MKFSILDEDAWKKYSGMRLYSAFITVERDDLQNVGGREREWICETKSRYLVVKYFGGMLSMGSAETFYNVKDRMSLIGRATTKEKQEKIKFIDVKNFMHWKINSKDYSD
jgi:hypothetical protein